MYDRPDAAQVLPGCDAAPIPLVEPFGSTTRVDVDGRWAMDAPMWPPVEEWHRWCRAWQRQIVIIDDPPPGGPVATLRAQLAELADLPGGIDTFTRSVSNDWDTADYYSAMCECERWRDGITTCPVQRHRAPRMPRH